MYKFAYELVRVVRRFSGCCYCGGIIKSRASAHQTHRFRGCGEITFTILGDGPDDFDSFFFFFWLLVLLLTTPTYERVFGFACP